MFQQTVAKFKGHDNWFKMVNGCRRIIWNISTYLPDHKASCSGDCHIQNKLYIACTNTLNVIYLKHINIIHSRKQKLLQTSSIYELKLSQMHSFSTSPSFCLGKSVINLMWSQVQSNPQSQTINPGHQVNPMVKKEMSLNGITDTIREARQPISRHCYNLCTTHFPTSNMTYRIFNKDKM
jgi:hypothetical protein